MSRYLITHSLLDSWDYIFKAKEEKQDEAYSSFINILNRIQTPPTEEMLQGREFEQIVSDIIKTDKDLTEHRYFIGASKAANIIERGTDRVKLSKQAEINGIDYLLYEISYWVSNGVIYDLKYKEKIAKYDMGYYLDNTQHRMYFELVPEANRFIYLISDGAALYHEVYNRNESRPIQETIADFEQWLKLCGLWETYAEKWRS